MLFEFRGIRFLATVLIVFPLSLLFFSAADERPISFKLDPALYYNMVELVCSEGYYIQEHTLSTDDGYILTAYRIPGGKRRPKVTKKKIHYLHLHRHHHPDFDNCFKESMNQTFRGPPVLLSHGLSAASDCWVLQGAERDLAYMLADFGYDVWFSNIRGNFYSRRHKTLRPQDRAYWDFSFHENGIYDMANTIDYVLDLTGFQKLYYIGHSMGTTMFFAMASVRPEYNEKISLFIGLTPVAHVRWQSYDNSARAVLHVLTLIVEAYVRNGVFQFLPRNNLSNLLTRMACSLNAPGWIQDICYDVSFSFTGFSSKLFTREKLPVYLSHGFSGSSIKTFLHYAQLLFAPKFQFYDYGPEENIRRYAQSEPPQYDVSKITAPVALYYSQGDFVSNYKDVLHLKSLLPNLVVSHEYIELNHVDFIWAYNAKHTIYNELLKLMDKYKKG